MSFGTVVMSMNLREVKLSSRAVIPVALAIPIAPNELRPRVVVPASAPSEPDDRARTSANCPNYWL
jgi:hypothetical protein